MRWFLLGLLLGELEKEREKKENSYKPSVPNIRLEKQKCQKNEQKENKRQVGKLCTNVFDDEDENVCKQEGFSSRVHYHNDPREYSPKSFRKYPKEPGKLCKNVFDDNYDTGVEEKGPVLKKKKN